ncbi:glycoside hydrolase family 16 protein [Boletus edulis BED1]|uniref:Glycoside hydrolase family 16 protein n=1 Tax=Boletus edulis BED1 TaxID=1328754 RepID=A0AAD4BXE5_BOLED|nr:glycoside hydrolase family 16 protein [Boletus edulis BED1]
MKSFNHYIAALLLWMICSVLAGQTYSKSLDITGAGFYNEFFFETPRDPTHGRVEYVDQQTAQQHNLTYATNGTFILRADYTTYLTPSDPGRKSVRIKSHKQFSTFVAIFDIRHMPVGCGTWPAVWMLGNDWPNQGEIDILEGVNSVSPNIASLHTGSNCNMPPARNMTGQSVGQDCAAYETGNDGCGVQFVDHASFGHLFNNAQGGWYAVERTTSDIKVYFWSRNDSSVPHQVGWSYDIIEPDTWGQPAAAWSNEKCDFADHFGPHSIMVNIAFCGDWAGAVYSQSGCPDTCENFVDTNPGSFYDAYFDFSGIRIYT